MSDANQLRDRATRLFAMALKAHETGFVSAVELEKLASEALAQAENMERLASAPPTPEAPQQVAQQQQQPQPKTKKE